LGGGGVNWHAYHKKINVLKFGILNIF
jgi:hypothetical protein